MQDIRKNVRILLGIVVVFIINKMLLRPYVLENDFPEYLNIFVLSFPNLCEAIAGSILLVNLGLYGNQMFLKPTFRVKEHVIYKVSILVAAIYVILQEFKIHNLGGRNTYDPYDVLFSVMGLVIAYALFHYLKPKMYTA